MAILDLSKVNANAFLPEGESICTVRAARDTKSKEKGTDMVEIEFADKLGRNDKVNFVLSEKALFRIKQLALALGYTEDSMQRINTASFVGKKVLVIKTQKGVRMYDGKEYKDYEHSFGPAQAAEAGSANTATAASDDDIPF